MSSTQWLYSRKKTQAQRRLTRSERLRTLGPILEDARSRGIAAPKEQRLHAEAEDMRAMHWRLLIAATVLASVFCFLGARVYGIQITRHQDYVSMWGQSQVEEAIPAARGAIYGRDGALYAITRLTGKSLYVVPCLLDAPGRRDLANQLAVALNRDADALMERLLTYRDRKFIWIKQQLTVEEIAACEPIVAQYEASGFRDVMMRLYPQNEILSTVLGFTNIDGNGSEGIEARLDATLRGTDGLRWLLRDGAGRGIRDTDLPMSPPIDGADVYLTINYMIQCILEEELEEVMTTWEPKGAWGLVMDPHTGEVLAMASRPSYDTNLWRTAPADTHRNRVITDVFEPGSVIKPLVMMAALRDGIYPTPPVPPRDSRNRVPDEALRGEPRIDCHGGAFNITYRQDGRRYSRVLHDAHGYGLLPLSMVLVKSSNIGMAQVGLRLGAEHLLEEIARLGFGRATGVGLPGEIGGIMPPEERCPEVHTVPSVTMGHAISVTALQMLTAFNTLANGGQLMRPVIVDRVQYPSGQEVITPRECVADMYPNCDHALAWMTDVLTRVAAPGGTASRANLDEYGISVAGKTGTAEKVVDGHYSSAHKTCSFIAFAPADDPQLSIMIVVDEPTLHPDGLRHYGGTVAGPAVRDVILRSLRSRPRDWQSDDE